MNGLRIILRGFRVSSPCNLVLVVDDFVQNPWKSSIEEFILSKIAGCAPSIASNLFKCIFQISWPQLQKRYKIENLLKKHLFLHLTKPVILLLKAFDFSHTLYSWVLYLPSNCHSKKHSGKKFSSKKSHATNYSVGLFETSLSKEISKKYSFEVKWLYITTADYNGYGYN